MAAAGKARAAWKAATFRPPDTFATVAQRAILNGTGNPLTDKVIGAACVTLVVALILVVFAPPMAQKQLKKKYHLPSLSLTRMCIYLVVTFFTVISLSYLPI